MPNILNQEWLNQNSTRNYPFREDLSLITNEDPDLRLPNSLMVDFVMMIAGETPRIHLSNLTLASSFISFTFKDMDDVVLATTNINTNTYNTYDPIF